MQKRDKTFKVGRLPVSCRGIGTHSGEGPDSILQGNRVGDTLCVKRDMSAAVW